MDQFDLQVAAGMIATMIFVLSTFPMLYKAARTKDLRSYSMANIVLANFGNLAYWVYVGGLEFGPVYLLHLFNTLSTGLMLYWRIRYAGR